MKAADLIEQLLSVQQDQFNGQGGGLNALPAGGAAGVYNSFNQPSGVRATFRSINLDVPQLPPRTTLQFF